MFKTDGPVLPPNEPTWQITTRVVCSKCGKDYCICHLGPTLCQCGKCCTSSEDLLSRLQRILEHQLNTNMHPLTCGNDSKHNVLIPVIVNGDIHLRCRDCDWVQTWNPLKK